MKYVELKELAATGGGFVDPSKYLTEVFDLYSIPAYDAYNPEILPGSEIGSTKKLVQPKDVLISRIVPHIRRVWVVGPNMGRRQIASGEWIVFRGDSFIPNYLRHYLMSDPFHQQFMRTVTGVGGSLLRARPSQVEKIKVPLPALPEQKRIAAILDKADAIRRKRQQAIKLADDFLRATFLDMFGDPVTNPKGWALEEFGKVCETRLGKMLDGKQQTGKHLRSYLRNTNVQWGRLDLSDVYQMDFTEKDRKEFCLIEGDVLICEGGEVGRAAVWRGDITECYFQKALHRARPRIGLATSEYIANTLYFMAKHGGLSDHVTSATIAHLTGVKLKGLRIPIPPFSLQEKYDAIIRKCRALRVSMDARHPTVEDLSKSATQRAFRGEL